MCRNFWLCAEDCVDHAPCTDYVCEAVDSRSNGLNPSFAMAPASSMSNDGTAQAGDRGMHNLPEPMLPMTNSPQVQSFLSCLILSLHVQIYCTNLASMFYHASVLYLDPDTAGCKGIDHAMTKQKQAAETENRLLPA